MATRPATLADIPAIIRLQRLIHADHVALDPARWLARDDSIDAVYDEWLRELIGAPHGTVLVSETDSGVAGYLIAEIEPESRRHWSPRSVYVHDVFVDPSARRQGVARALMLALGQWAKTNHPDLPVRLLTAGPNESGRLFFQSLGYRVSAVEMIDR